MSASLTAATLSIWRTCHAAVTTTPTPTSNTTTYSTNVLAHALYTLVFSCSTGSGELQVPWWLWILPPQSFVRQILEMRRRSSGNQDLWQRTGIRRHRLQIPDRELRLPAQRRMRRQDRAWWAFLHLQHTQRWELTSHSCQIKLRLCIRL